MKAVVLVGGEGTRMRPLTETIPKPLLQFMGRPFLHHVLDHLARHGVHEVVLSSPYLEETFHPFLRERHGDPAITWITEAEPLGTAGAIVNALHAVADGAFLVLNGDVLTDLDLTAMAGYHRARDAVATIALTHVDDARPYGLVETTEDGRVLEFLEKPGELVPGEVNAGTYVLEPRALDGWGPGRAISIELEVYPALIERGEPVFAFPSEAYWMDVGTPERYLQAHFDALDGRVHGLEVRAPMVAASAVVGADARLGRLVVVGADARIGPGATVERSVVHEGATIGGDARVDGSILGQGSRVGARAVVTDCVLAEEAAVPEDAVAEGARVPPGHVAATTR
jgi:mannose-1-phosphate guanylyltransferase